MARTGLVGVVAVISLHLWRGIDLPFLVGTPPFFFSNGFVTDLGAGALVALVILLVRDISNPFYLDVFKGVEDVASSALLPLPGIGLVAVGSRDGNRFYPGMGTLFLRMMGDTLVTALKRFDG